jgi:hypothetical protein
VEQNDFLLLLSALYILYLRSRERENDEVFCI